MLEIKITIDDLIEEEIIKAIVKREGGEETPEDYGLGYLDYISYIREYNIDRFLDARDEYATELGLDIDALIEAEFNED